VPLTGMLELRDSGRIVQEAVLEKFYRANTRARSLIQVFMSSIEHLIHVYGLLVAAGLIGRKPRHFLDE
jgi:hypothetical protein